MIIKLKPKDTITIVTEGRFPQRLRVVVGEDGSIFTKGGEKE